jgi:glutamate-1-semialdehyde 2,1-aminomutase
MRNVPSYARSEALFARARRVMPGGNTRTTVFAEPHPIYLARGEGARVYDVDGNSQLDFDNNFTSLIHGHNFPPVTSALREQVGHGTSFSAPTEAEVELAELLCERVPHFEQVRFMNSGTEAVMNAIKAARAYTGRAKIAKVEGAYHGAYDVVQVSLDSKPENWDSKEHPARIPYDAGVPASVLADAVVIPFNELDATRRILTEHQTELAALLIDPVPSRAGLVPADPSYLEFLRQFTRDHGILLVADEVLSFRLSWQGAIATFGVTPDLCAFGKIIGGGLPIGAVAGRNDFMAVFDPSKGKPRVSQAGTFTANPLSMVAGTAAMRALTPESFDRLNALGEYARERLRDCFIKAGVDGHASGAGSLFRLHFKKEPVRSYRDAYPTATERGKMSRLVAFARENGIIVSQTGLGALSTPMQRSDIDELADVILRGLHFVR